MEDRPTATESMLNVISALEETEEYYELAGEVVRLAREFLLSKKHLSEGYRKGHSVLSDVSRFRRSAMHKAEDDLDAAVETLEKWLKAKGHETG